MDDGTVWAGGAIHLRGSYCVGLFEEQLNDNNTNADLTPRKFLLKRRVITCLLLDPYGRGGWYYEQVGFDGIY